jgi:hypothetical protein
MPKTGINSCDQPGDFQTLDVVVAEYPTIQWDGTTTRGACGLDSTTQEIPVIMTGSKQITVTYDLVYYPLTGNAVTTSDLTVNFNTGNNNGSNTGNIQIDIPKGNFGRYELTIKGITDSVAKKCGVAARNRIILRKVCWLNASAGNNPIKFVTDLY